jgi:hypothetical protein
MFKKKIYYYSLVTCFVILVVVTSGSFVVHKIRQHNRNVAAEKAAEVALAQWQTDMRAKGAEVEPETDKRIADANISTSMTDVVVTLDANGLHGSATISAGSATSNATCAIIATPENGQPIDTTSPVQVTEKGDVKCSNGLTIERNQLPKGTYTVVIGYISADERWARQAYPSPIVVQ